MTDPTRDTAATPAPDANDTLRRLIRGRLAGYQLRGGDLLQGRLTDRGAALIAKHLTPAIREALAGHVAAGDDTLRQALTTIIGNHTVPIKATLPNGEQTWPASIHILIGESEVAELADALLPLIRDHVAAAVQAGQDRISRHYASVAEAAIERVRHLHRRLPWPECHLDGESWPCRTIRELDGMEATNG